MASQLHKAVTAFLDDYVPVSALRAAEHELSLLEADFGARAIDYHASLAKAVARIAELEAELKGIKDAIAKGMP